MRNKKQNPITPLATVGLMLSCIAFSAAWAQEATVNADSLRPDEFLYIAGCDKQVYSYDDSIHVNLFVVNDSPTTTVILIHTLCDGVRAMETWCPPQGSSVPCFTVSENFGGCRGFGRVIIGGVAPGVTILQDSFLLPFHTLTIPQDWTFQSGSIEFDGPWQPPRFVLRVSYERRGPTAIEGASWSTIKVMFR